MTSDIIKSGLFPWVIPKYTNNRVLTMARPRLSDAVKYERECDKVAKTFTRKMFSKIKKEHKESAKRSKKITQKTPETIMANSLAPVVYVPIDTFGGHKMSGDVSNLPTDILRDIYKQAVVLRNEDNMKKSARTAALEIVENLTNGCSSTYGVRLDTRDSFSFKTQSKKLGFLKLCMGGVKADGTLGHKAILIFASGGNVHLTIKQRDGEFKVEYADLDVNGRFEHVVAEYIIKEFNKSHILVNRRRPTSGWIKKQMKTKNVEEISKETNISVYRLKKILEQ